MSSARIPVIGPYLPKVEVHGRERPQWDIEKEVFAKLRDIPDVRILKLNDRGERDLSFNFLSKNEKDLNEAVGILEVEAARRPAAGQCQRRRRPAASGTADPPAQGSGGPPRHHAAADLRDDPRRHDRRCRRGACEDLARRSPDPDPRPGRARYAPRSCRHPRAEDPDG